MGIFSKLANAVTGGWVKVKLEWSAGTGPRELRVRVTTDPVKSEGEIQSVYVQVLAEEAVTIPDVSMARNEGGVIKTTTESVSRTEATFNQRIEIAGPQSLQAGQTYEWTGVVNLPADGKPTYKGVNANHTWKILAGLAAKGNDPDSGWQEVPVDR
jgi:hypothetical protein